MIKKKLKFGSEVPAFNLDQIKEMFMNIDIFL